MIKIFLPKLLLFGGLLAFAGPAWALTIEGGSVEVGGVDARIEESAQINGDAAVEAWVKSKLGNDVSFVFKYDNLSSSDWHQTDELGTWAFYLPDSPDAFLVKTGNNHTNDFRTYLFTNEEFKNWAVLDLGDIYVASVTNIAKVSYVSTFNGAAPVPEPGTLLLLGAGLTGLAVYRRFK